MWYEFALILDARLPVRDPFGAEDVAEFDKPIYGKEKVRYASDALKGSLYLCGETSEIFRIAHNWRSSHIYPMFRLRHDLRGKVQRNGNGGITASRLKRMSSIRKKIRKTKFSLVSIQDIAGCRAILPCMNDVINVADMYFAQKNLHKIENNNNYIERPKAGGYRSHHIVLAYRGMEPNYRNMNVEIQLRTRLQHCWATAVEAVGMVRGEDLKGGQGDKDWLRFFELVSSEFALEEAMPLGPGVEVDEKIRRQEIRDIERRLDAINILDAYNKIINTVTNTYNAPWSRYFVVSFDAEKQTVDVRSFRANMSGADDYFFQETAHENRNTVLVEVDKAEELAEAYPNYFLDVTAFTSRVKRIVGKPDYSWLKTMFGRH